MIRQTGVANAIYVKNFALERCESTDNNNTIKVANIKAYFIMTLYNATNTINHYYNAEVDRDMYGID